MSFQVPVKLHESMRMVSYCCFASDVCDGPLERHKVLINCSLHADYGSLSRGLRTLRTQPRLASAAATPISLSYSSRTPGSYYRQYWLELHAVLAPFVTVVVRINRTPISPTTVSLLGSDTHSSSTLPCSSMRKDCFVVAVYYSKHTVLR